MATVSVQLPDALAAWVESQVSSGRYADAEDYLRDLVRRDQDEASGLIDMLEEGAACGVSSRTIDDIWEAAKRDARGG